MRVLGANGTGDTMWLACSDHDGLFDLLPFQVKLPRALESGHQTWHRRAGREQADGEIAIPLVALDEIGEVPERVTQALPAAVLLVLF